MCTIARLVLSLVEIVYSKVKKAWASTRFDVDIALFISVHNVMWH